MNELLTYSYALLETCELRRLFNLAVFSTPIKSIDTRIFLALSRIVDRSV